MSMFLENIKDLDKHGDAWRENFNGVDAYVHCDRCHKNEEDAQDMFRFRNDDSFFELEFMYCESCVSDLKKAMHELLAINNA